MKSLLSESTKSLISLMGLLVLGLCFGCQKDLNETQNAYEPVSLSTVQASVKTSNFLVITKTETFACRF